MELTGDLTGRKIISFMFPDEIVYLGAGLEVRKSDDQIITVVDNVPVTTATKVSIPNPKNGYYIVRNQAKAGGGWERVRYGNQRRVHARNWSVSFRFERN